MMKSKNDKKSLQGVIDTINQKVYDGEGTLRSEKKVRYFEDGTPPIVISSPDNGDPEVI